MINGNKTAEYGRLEQQGCSNKSAGATTRSLESPEDLF